MKIKVIAFFSIFLLCALAYGQENSLFKQDGNDWLKSTRNDSGQSYNLGTISGIIMGSSVVVDEIKGTVEIAKIFLAKASKVQIDMVESGEKRLKDFDFVNITIGQINEGMKIFYDDFANRRIKIIDAVFVVKMQIKGKDPDLIQAQIRYLRMQPIDQDEFKAFTDKVVADSTKISEEEWFRQGRFRDKNNISHRLFKYGDY